MIRQLSGCKLTERSRGRVAEYLEGEIGREVLGSGFRRDRAHSPENIWYFGDKIVGLGWILSRILRLQPAKSWINHPKPENTGTRGSQSSRQGSTHPSTRASDQNWNNVGYRYGKLSMGQRRWVIVLFQFWLNVAPQLFPDQRRNNRRDRGDNNVLVPQLFGRSFQKARNFTASSHQNVWFSIWIFKNFSGVIPPDPHSERGRPPPAPNTQPDLWPGAGGGKRPGVGTQTLVPLNFSAVIAPLSPTGV